ncbi:hypothetical protein H206_00126 [Candidatus Electrothrix aarhusensis]|uniref:Uncharacterized protein n=1 Tax=Candidatus Electrothrix aarhusensis TaxID=1859131 RepID=A0A3S4TBH7_9BACT|nr:hypothetical protein H206_00126 [Candidatus Electrothrix aarhusensis]
MSAVTISLRTISHIRSFCYFFPPTPDDGPLGGQNVKNPQKFGLEDCKKAGILKRINPRSHAGYRRPGYGR